MTQIFRKLATRYDTPKKVQDLLMSFPYNGKKPETMKSAISVWDAKTAHCLEATHFAAAILEHCGYPTLALSLESEDNIGHVVFLFQENKKWGAVGRSKEPGLQGRRPVFASLHGLAMSYFDEYVDDTGRLIAYQRLNLDDSDSDWRFSSRNVWKSEKYILQSKHIRVPRLDFRYQKALRTHLNTGHSPKPYWW
jgi:hypothetical protein